MKFMSQLDLAGKRVLIREDFNVPLENGKITHTARIDAALPTLKEALAKNAKVIVLSHLGRPTAGKFDQAFSLQPVADYLSQCLQQKVLLLPFTQPFPPLNSGQLVLLENVRFLEGEEDNSATLGKQLAALGDIFVMDAFAVAHRAQASTCSVAQYADIACGGPLLQKELEALNLVMLNPRRPIVAIVGGSKVSTKLQLLNNLLEKVDILILGGGIANTFLAAQGHFVGESLMENDLIPAAIKLLEKAKKSGKAIWLPEDVIVASDLMDNETSIRTLGEIKSHEKIFDIGPLSQKSLTEYIQRANTILWNGPLGVFEKPAFSQGTKVLAAAIAASNAFSVAGGGDTLAAIEQFHVGNSISYLSTGGGAFLECLEGKTLPAVAALEHRARG